MKSVISQSDLRAIRSYLLEISEDSVEDLVKEEDLSTGYSFYRVVVKVEHPLDMGNQIRYHFVWEINQKFFTPIGLRELVGAIPAEKVMHKEPLICGEYLKQYDGGAVFEFKDELITNPNHLGRVMWDHIAEWTQNA